MVLTKKKSRIRETKHLSTDADSSTDAIGGWTKNTPKPDFLEKREKSSKTNLNITASYQYNRLISQYTASCRYITASLKQARKISKKKRSGFRPLPN